MVEPAGRRVGRRDLRHGEARPRARTAPPISQPITTEKAPPAENATGNAVMPPARMQMIENEMAKLEKPPILRASSWA